MEFRPCIDIHNGKVKQIVGGTLRDSGDQASENFVAAKDASYYAGLYRDAGIRGGHVILLNGSESSYYEATRQQALSALGAYPQGLQVGGGITPDNAEEYLDAGASHVIVTSYVFRDGEIHFDRLERLRQIVGKERLVLDVSCRRQGEDYLVVTDRWQKMTREVVNGELLHRLSAYCDEFLIHAVDVEGKANGIERELISRLCNFRECPITYAGGVRDYEDLEIIRSLSEGRMNVTIGSALDLFGGKLDWMKVHAFCREKS